MSRTMKHFLSIADHSTEQIKTVLDMSVRLREQRRRGQPHEPVLQGKTLAMLFEKPSLRTRVSFEVAITELGGSAISLRPDEVGLGKRETPADAARVLEGMVHGIIARVFEHQKLLDMAAVASVPVINALSDDLHPCQALADVLTLIDEFGPDLAGRTVAYVGDGNNVAVSLASICAMLDMRFVIASPEGYDMPADAVAALARQGGPQPVMLRDPARAVAEADAIYTDTWVSMGQEDEAERRRRAFGAYQLNEALIDAAPEHAVVLHCLPAYRNVEITDGVMDGPRSRVFPQAHNRLHAQKGLLAVLYANG